MTRSSRCPNRDDRGQAVVTAGAGEKPQGRESRFATGPGTWRLLPPEKALTGPMAKRV
jgi:hypothetical protein